MHNFDKAPYFTFPVWAKKKQDRQAALLSYWCERRDLNPYGYPTRTLNVRVCRFRHSRKSIVNLSTTKPIITDSF